MMRNFKHLLLLFMGIALLTGCSGEETDDYTDRMAIEHEGDTPEANESAMHLPQVQVTESEVVYGYLNGDALRGYYSEPEDAPTDLPGLIVIHEWWGLNDNIRMMTRRLAGEGYRALAVDVYNGEVAETSDEAQQLMRNATENREDVLAHMTSAYQFLKDQMGASKVGSIGWCFGGAWSLNTALALPDQLDAAVIYYGRLETDPEVLEPLEMPILGIFGEEDSGIPVENVLTFEQALRDLGIEHDIHIYEGADHAFANPSGNRYHPEAAEDAWEKTVEFLQNTLKE